MILILILFVDTTLWANRKKISETRIIYCIYRRRVWQTQKDSMCPVRLCMAAVIQVCVRGHCSLIRVCMRLCALQDNGGIERKQTEMLGRAVKPLRIDGVG